MSENKTAIQKTIYDNAKNHFLGNFPESLPIEQAYVHIGMFLGWMIDNELYSEYFEDESGAQIYRFKKKDEVVPFLVKYGMDIWVMNYLIKKVICLPIIIMVVVSIGKIMKNHYVTPYPLFIMLKIPGRIIIKWK